MRRAARNLVGALLLLTSSALAQGVLDRLEGEFNVLATATNEHETFFVEVDATPSNIEQALREGILHEDFGQYVLIVSPGSTYVAIKRSYGVLYSERAWTSFMGLANANSQGLTLRNLTFSGSGGYKLTPEYIESSYASYRYRTPARASSGTAPRNGCVSNTTSTGSTMTCYSDGRVTYHSVCTVNPVKYAISCRSDSY